MRLGVLRTGAPPAELAHYPSYPDMFKTALGDGFTYRAFDVEGGELPERGDCDAYLITGSPAGVYDDLPWIAPLRDWIASLEKEIPLVGICFGHQIMAEAYGGQVVKSEKGWGGGLHAYDVIEQRPWMDSAAPYAIPVSHQDQVVVKPPAARLIGANEFCPIAALDYDDRRAMSFQCHPEFAPDYAAELVRRRVRLGIVTPERGEELLASLARDNDRARVQRWMRAFLKGA